MSLGHVLEKVQVDQLMQVCSDIPMVVRTGRYVFRFKGGRNSFFKIFPSGQCTFNVFRASGVSKHFICYFNFLLFIYPLLFIMIITILLNNLFIEKKIHSNT